MLQVLCLNLAQALMFVPLMLAGIGGEGKGKLPQPLQIYTGYGITLLLHY
jgi:hypothetical protein